MEPLPFPPISPQVSPPFGSRPTFRWGRFVAIVFGVLFGSVAVAFTLAVVRQMVEEQRGARAPGANSVALSRSPQGVLRPSLGDLAAPVVVVEFFDFECPFCRQAVPIVDQLAADPAWAGKVRFVFRHFPLPDVHQNAIAAARAAECANQQGQFLPMRQLLFANQERLGPADLKQYASRLPLDQARFTRCLADPASYDAVQQDWRDGLKLGVEGTPTYFINDQKISGLPTRNQLEQAIRYALSL